MIDCGDGSVLEELPSIGVETVEMALITHHHRDQCQGANKLAGKGCTIAVPEHEKPLFADAESFWLSRQVYDSYNDRSTTNSPVRNIRVDEVLEDYDQSTVDKLETCDPLNPDTDSDGMLDGYEFEDLGKLVWASQS